MYLSTIKKWYLHNDNINYSMNVIISVLLLQYHITVLLKTDKVALNNLVSRYGTGTCGVFSTYSVLLLLLFCPDLLCVKMFLGAGIWQGSCFHWNFTFFLLGWSPRKDRMDHKWPGKQGMVHLRNDPFNLPSQWDPILQAKSAQDRLPW